MDNEAPMQRVLFICTGNFYRSRFAEAVFNHHAKRQRLAWSAFSRGLAIHLIGGDLSPHTESALALRGIAREATGETRVSLTKEDLEAAHLSIALKEAEHRPYMREQFPDWEDRITYWGVHDLDVAPAEAALPEIERRVLQLLHKLGRQRPEAKA